MKSTLEIILEANRTVFKPVVDFNPDADRLLAMNLSVTNKRIDSVLYEDLPAFTDFMEAQRAEAGAKFLVGGYLEKRDIYRRSSLFDKNLPGSTDVIEESRCMHLGVDIWGTVGTAVYAPIGGSVYGLAFHDHLGDYGATIILQHQLDAHIFYTLYGHVSLRDIGLLRIGQFVAGGNLVAHFGDLNENGQWPPHLHFQIIEDLGNHENDYPGVCKASELDIYRLNCPNPEYILQFKNFLHSGLL